MRTFDHVLSRAAALAVAASLAANACQATPAPSAPASTTESPSGSATAPAATTVDPASALAYSVGQAENHDIWLVRLDGAPAVKLTSGAAKEWDPALSPDGRWIAYRQDATPGQDDADIWLMAADGSGKRNLTNAPQGKNWSPNWMPDGRIAFTSSRDDGVPELWTMASDGTDVRKVADGWCEYADPSPDGTQFVCSGPRLESSSYELWVVDAANGGRRQLTVTRETDFGAAWSPDGAWIAYGRQFPERWSLRRIKPDGTGDEEIATEGVFPAWSPDGRLAWSGPGGINVARADGSGKTIIGYAADFISWGR
jgi:TolB protein